MVGDELVYLLPQPPPDMSAFEQSPDYPERHPYLGQGYPVLVLSLFGIMFWELDGVWAIQMSPTWWISMLLGFGFGVLNVHFARHILGGAGISSSCVGHGPFVYGFDDHIQQLYCFDTPYNWGGIVSLGVFKQNSLGF